MDRFSVLEQLFKIINPLGLFFGPFGLVLIFFGYLNAPLADYPPISVSIFLVSMCLLGTYLSYRYCRNKLGWFKK